MHRALRSASLLVLLLLATQISAVFAAEPASVVASAPQASQGPAALGTDAGRPAPPISPAVAPGWLPAAGLPACFQTICENVCFKKGRGCEVAGQTCSCI
jgi:hypothetical protein